MCLSLSVTGTRQSPLEMYLIGITHLINQIIHPRHWVGILVLDAGIQLSI